MLSTFYRVSIAGISGSGDAAGFIDNMKVEQYMANGSVPSTFTASTNKVRANIRYKNVIEKLQSMGNVYISNVVATAANANVGPTTFSFTIETERGDEVLTTLDENNTGTEISGAAAISRCVARGIVESRLNYVYAVYDPTATKSFNGPGAANAIARRGSVTTTFNVNAVTTSLSTAEAAITVTPLV